MSLLPPNSTPLELAIERIVGDRIDAIGVDTAPVGQLLSPSDCPANMLPWLAWAVSADMWDSDWPEDRKRAVVASSLTVHRKKGTIGAVKDALNALSLVPDITEWFEDGSAPHTFKIDVVAENLIANGYRFDETFLPMVSQALEQVKPARSHFTLRVGERFRHRPNIAHGFRGLQRDARRSTPSPRSHLIGHLTRGATGLLNRVRSNRTHVFVERAA